MALALGCVAWVSPVSAVADGNGDGWKQSAIIYLLAPTISGTTGIGPANADLDIDAGTVFDTLDGAFLGMYLAEKNDWGWLVDVVYMDLKEDFELPAGYVTGELGNEQLVAMVASTWRLNEQWHLVGGISYTDIDMRLRLSGPQQSRVARRSESWVDPVIGARFSTPLSDHWTFGAYGLIGGFGVGSDFTWSLNASFTWQFGEHTSLVMGARYLDFDYEDGSGPDRFKFDVAEYGPAVGFRWDW